ASGESEVADAGQQVRGQGDDLGPGDVDRPEPRRPPIQTEILGLLDVVIHVHVGAVPGIQPGHLPAPGGGGHQPDAAAPLPVPAALAAAGADVFEQLVGEPGAVQADQQPVPVAAGQAGHGQVQQGDVVRGAVGGGVARPRVDDQHIVGIVTGGQVGAEASAAL